VPEPVSDEALARRAAAGETAAFEELVRRHQDMLYTLALRVTLSEQDARDCVQEGLIAAWRSIGRFRGDSRVSTWLYRIVLRKSYDVLDLTAAAERPPEDRLDIIAALGSLDPDFRAAVVACDIIGLSMEDAAAVLEVPPGTVRSRLSRARDRLAALLEANRT